MTLLMLTTRQRVHVFVWAIVLSLGFYGIKGGIFTIINGGVHRVQGPPGTFIEGNNEMALALVMSVPLMRYLHLQERHHLVKAGLVAAMLLTAVAAVGSQSRGALVALVITGTIFWWKSRNKFTTGLLIAIAVLIAGSIMPAEWYERMNTIKTFEEDESAQGRINAWWTAWNLAKDRVFGGGFELWQRPVFQLYAPDPTNARDVHSIYFEVMGEHGFVGLFLFLSLLLLTWLKCNSVIRRAKRQPDALWARDLASMIQVTMVAYMSAGAFLGLAYFDLTYHLVAIVVVVHHLLITTGPAGQMQAPAATVRPVESRRRALGVP
jgi:putative inorganic carbon (hco3(-)) transporter